MQECPDEKRLRGKIFLATTACVLIPLAVLGFSLSRQVKTAYEAKENRELALVTAQKCRGIDGFLAERLAQLTTVAATHPLAYFLRPGSLEEVFTLLQARAGCYTDFGIIDENGDHIAYTGPSPTVRRANFRNQAWFGQIEAKGYAISDVYPGLRRSPHFIIAVARREGGKSWILRAAIDSDAFDALVRGDRLGPAGDAFLLNPAGVLQSTPRSGGRLLEAVRLGRRITRFPGVRIANVVLNGKPARLGLTWLTHKDWLLAVRLDPGEDAAPLARAGIWFWTLLAAGLLAGLATARFISRGVSARLHAAAEERRRLEAALEESNRMAGLGKMAAGVAHEITNPLAIIKEQAGWMHDLLEEEDVKASPNFAEYADAIGKIEHHVKRAKDVAHRMLGFARRSEPSREPVDVNALIGQSVDFLQKEAGYRSIAIACDLQKDLPAITSDPAQLQQILLNLIGNAIDAIGQDGEIRITTWFDAATQKTRIGIADNGPGIPKDSLEKIFEPFFTTKKAGEGTGLGLSICAEIAHRLGGDLRVESTEGRGATFTLELPRGAAS